MQKVTKTFILVVMLFLKALMASAQIPVESWRDHLPYNVGKVVIETSDRVYCATNLALFYYNKTDYSINKLSKINLLSDLEIGHMAYSQKHNKIVVGYANGNIDILLGDTKYNFPDIKQKNIIADKTIYHIDIFDDFAYLSTGFGIVVFDLAKNEFADTYIIGPGGSYLKINTTATYDNKLYALTDNGIYFGNLDDPFLSNYQNWIKDTALLNPEEIYYSAALFNNQFYAVNRFGTTDSCHINVFDGQKWDTLFTDMENIKSITADQSFVVVKQWHVEVYNTLFEHIVHYSAHNAQQAIYNENKELWIADSKEGLILTSPQVYLKTIHPDGPISEKDFEILHNNNTMLVAPGGYSLGTGTNSYSAADVYRFADESWESLLKNAPAGSEFADMRDIIGFVYQTNPDNYMAYSWGYGMVEVENGEIINYHNSATTNGVLTNFISGATYDAYGNLYMVCRESLKPFVVKTPDNKWYSYDYNGALVSKQTHKLINNNRNNDKWTISMVGDGIFVYNDMATPDYSADDTYRQFLLTDNANNIISTRINDIIQDVEGSIWLATANGVAVYDYPKYAIPNDENFYARVPQIVVDGYLKGLLEGENVTCIGVDGANRKWLGTEGGGLFLVSGDGTEQVIIYNTDNSKLFSNNIVSIDINQRTGEVFIGTDKGILSYKSTATENIKNFDSIYAFPNPVTPAYSGLITIRGLRYETTVKITDMAGHLVFETLSNGGDAIWNGKDLSGQPVASGTYLVFCTTPDGEDSGVTKILIVK